MKKMNNTDKNIPTLIKTYHRMMEIAGNEAPALRHSLLCALLSSIMQGLAFSVLYPLFDCILNTPEETGKIGLWLSVLVVFALFDWLFRWRANDFGYSKKLANVMHDLRFLLGVKLRKMPLQTLYQNRTGALASVLGGSIDEVVAPLGMLAETFIRGIIVPLVVVIATAFVNWQMALALMVIFPVVIPFYRWLRHNFGEKMAAMVQANANSSSEIVEYTQGLPVLRAAIATGKKAKRLKQALDDLYTEQKKSHLNDIIPNLIIWTLIEGGIVLVLALGTLLTLWQVFSIAGLSALLIMIVRLAEPLALVCNIAQVFDLMEAGFEQIEKILKIDPLPSQSPQQVPTKFNICFDNISFTYVDSIRPELENINFELPSNSMTALVGPSGSGKTTIIRMIMRYADPQQGKVRIGGHDIRSMTQESLMRNISVVFQDVYLFDDTIFSNILMGNPNATDLEVKSAAKAAYCHEFIQRLPQGYQTRVGDIGGSLSGGERQRISIARAILKDAPIVILDEPTAALDTESELAVQKAIDVLVKKRTVIVIAHRLSTIVGADKILVLDNGKLVQSGTHTELIECTGRYQSMWKAQQRVKHWHLV